MRGHGSYRFAWVGILWVFLFVSVFGPLAPAAQAQGSYIHEDNPSQVGEIVIPSPFDTRYPFPMYVPLEVKQELIEQSKNDNTNWSALQARYQDRFGIYPHVDLGSDEEGGEIIKNITFLKPFSDMLLFGEFFQGPKKRFLDELQTLYSNTLVSARAIMQRAKEVGRISAFGSFVGSPGVFHGAAGADPRIKAHIETFMNSLYQAHDVIQTLLFMPTESVDPDLTLDYINALGVGPQIWQSKHAVVEHREGLASRRIDSNEGILKRTLQRFCTTSYLYRYVAGKTREEGQALGLNVDQFSAPFLLAEAMGDELGGLTLAARRQHYAAEYARLIGQSLTPQALNDIIGVSKTWARVPTFFDVDDKITQTFDLMDVYVPLTQVGADIKIHSSFVEFVERRAETLSQSLAEPTEPMRELHRESFLSSMGYRYSQGAALEVQSFAGTLLDHPFEFLRIKDQFLVFRGLYESKDFSLVGSDVALFSTQFQHLSGAFDPVRTDENRRELEDVIPQVVCESLYKRNYVTQVLMTHADVNAPPPTPYEHVTDTPRIARDWFEPWMSHEFLDRLYDAYRGIPGFVSARRGQEISLENRAALDRAFSTLQMRPWSIYSKLYYLGKKPQQNIRDVNFLNDRTYTLTQGSLSDFILPRFFSRFGGVEKLIPALWQTGLRIFPRTKDGSDALNSRYDQFVESLQSGIGYLRAKPYEVENYAIGNYEPADQMDRSGVSVAYENDALAQQRIEELTELSNHLARSRVLFTPQELHMILVTYFKEFLLPLSLMQKFMDGDVLTTGSNGYIVPQLKRFFMHAGNVQYELLALLQNSGEGMFFDVSPGILTQDNTLRAVWRSEDITTSTEPTKTGYVISFAQMWDKQEAVDTVIDEWSKHDGLKASADKIERVMNKRVVWCKTLPLSTFSDLARQVNLPEESVQELLCALPGYFHVVRDLGLFLAKEHVRYDAMKHFFAVQMSRENENFHILPFLSHVPPPAVINSPLKARSDPDDPSGHAVLPELSLQEGIHQYQELMNILRTYGQTQSWFSSPSGVITRMFNIDTYALNWTYTPPGSLHGVALNDESFDESCNYTGTALNPFLQEREVNEVKMVCLFNHVKTVYEVLVDPVIEHENRVHTLGVEGQVNITSPFASAMHDMMLDDITDVSSHTEDSVEYYMKRLSQRLSRIDGVFAQEVTSDCTDVEFEFNADLYSGPSGNTYKDRVKKSISAVINTTAQQKIGSFVQNVVASACPAAKEASPEITPIQMFDAWKRILGYVNGAEHDGTGDDEAGRVRTYFGEAVLFENVGQEAPFHELASKLSQTYGTFLGMVGAAQDEREDSHYKNLKAELGLVYREMQFENQLHSLVAIKTAMTDDTLAREYVPTGLKNTDPLSRISSGMDARQFAYDIRTVSDVGVVDIFSQYTGIAFSYNRNTTGGSTLASALDLLGGIGGGATPGTTFALSEDSSWLESLVKKYIDRPLCNYAMDSGGRLMPWLSKDSSVSIIDALNPFDEQWAWRGWRLSIGGHKKDIVDPRYFCDLKYAHPQRENFRVLSSREQKHIDEANDFLSEIARRSEDESFKATRKKARYEIEADFVQVVLARVFLDKLTAHVLVPYREALEALHSLFEEIRELVAAHGESAHLGSMVFEKLRYFVDDAAGKGKLFREFFYLRQMFVSMVSELFPGGQVAGVDPGELKQKLFTLFGSLHHVQQAQARYLDQHPVAHSEDVSEEDRSRIYQEELEKGKYRHSIIAHVTHVIQELEAFIAEFGDHIITRYPILDMETMTRVDRSEDAVDWGADTPKYYHTLFASSLFDVFRQSQGPADSDSKTQAINAVLLNAMPKSNPYYNQYQDAFDAQLKHLVQEYPFSPSDLLTHRLGSNGRHYGDKKFRLFFLGSEDVLPASAQKRFHRGSTFDVLRGPDVPTSGVTLTGAPVMAQGPVESFVFGEEAVDNGGLWQTQGSYEGDRRTFLSGVAYTLFPWLRYTETGSEPYEFPNSLSDHMSELGKSQQSGVSQDKSDFFKYMAASSRPAFDFRQDGSPHRAQFSSLIDDLLIKQLQESQAAMRRTFQDIYDGKFTGEIYSESYLSSFSEGDVTTGQVDEERASGRDDAQEKTLVKLFSNEAMVQRIEARFGGRFDEIKYEFVPSKVYSYFEQEQAYINIMAELGSMLMAVILASAVIAIVDGLVGSRGIVSGAISRVVGTIGGRVAAALRFAFRMVGTFALATLGTYALFSWLADAPFMPVMILVALLMLWRTLKIPIVRGLKGAGFERLIAGLGMARTFLIGVVVMDVIGMLLDWEVANYTSAAYAHYNALFYSYMNLGGVYKSLYKQKYIGAAKDYEPLIADYAYLQYLKQAKVMNFSFAVLGTALASIMNVHVLGGFGVRRWQLSRFKPRVNQAREGIVRAGASAMGREIEALSEVALQDRILYVLTDQTASALSSAAIRNGGLARQISRLSRALDENMIRLGSVWEESEALRGALSEFETARRAFLEAEAYGRSIGDMSHQIESLLKRIHGEINRLFGEGKEIPESLRRVLGRYQDNVEEMLAVRNIARSDEYRPVRDHFESGLTDQDVRGRRFEPGDAEITPDMRSEAAYRRMEGDLSLRNFSRVVQPYRFARVRVPWLGVLSEGFRFPFRKARWGMQVMTALLLASRSRMIRQLDETLSQLARNMPDGSDGDVFRYLRENPDPNAYTQFLIHNRRVIPEVSAYLSEHPLWQGKVLSRESLSTLQEDLGRIQIRLADGSAKTLDEFALLHPNVIDVMRAGDETLDLNIRPFSKNEISSVLPASRQGRVGDLLTRSVDDMVHTGKIDDSQRAALFGWMDDQLRAKNPNWYSGNAIEWHVETMFPGDRTRALGRLFEQDPDALSLMVNAVSLTAMKRSGRIEDLILARLAVHDMIEQVSGRAFFDKDIITQLFTWEDFKQLEALQPRLGSGERLSTQMQALLQNPDRMNALRQSADRLGFDMKFSQVRAMEFGAQRFNDARVGDKVNWTALGPFVGRSRRVTPHIYDQMKYSPFFAGEKGAVDTRIAR